MADSDFPDLTDAMRDPKQFVGTDYADIDDTYAADEGLDVTEHNPMDPEMDAADEPVDEPLLPGDNDQFLPPADDNDTLDGSLDDLTDSKMPLDDATEAERELRPSNPPSGLDGSGPANPDSTTSTMSELPLDDDPEGVQYTDRDDDAGFMDFENIVIKPTAIDFRVWELLLYTVLSVLVSAIASNYVDEFPHVAINFDSSFKLGLASAIVYFFGCIHTRLFEIGQLILFGGLIGYAFPIAEKFGVVHSVFLLTDTAKIITLCVFFVAAFIAYYFDRQRALFGAETVVLFFYLLESILLWRQKRWVLLLCGSICHGLCLIFERRALPLGRTMLILAVLFTEQYIRVPNCHGLRILDEHRAVASWYCPT